ncbi:hypothetical protein SRB521_00508 [Intestinimonas butyriciproducens]|nr:hypothetical protein SRB521_00508 [Intestinimonas butyriciproducens]
MPPYFVITEEYPPIAPQAREDNAGRGVSALHLAVQHGPALCFPPLAPLSPALWF